MYGGHEATRPPSHLTRPSWRLLPAHVDASNALPVLALNYLSKRASPAAQPKGVSVDGAGHDARPQGPGSRVDGESCPGRAAGACTGTGEGELPWRRHRQDADGSSSWLSLAS